MSADIGKVAEDRLIVKFGARYPTRVIDPVSIGLIIDLIFKVLDRCKERREENVEESLREPRRVHEYVLRREIRKNNPDWSRREIVDAADDAFSVAAEATTEERLEFIREARAA